MTVRIKLQALTQNGSLYTYNDVPFTGEAYDHPDELLKKVYVLSQGLIVAEKDYGALVPEKAVELRIDDDLIDLDDANFDSEISDVPAYYNGQRFTGISYHYFNGFCAVETMFINGIDIEMIGWLPDGTGRMRAYDKDGEDFSYQFEWKYGQLIKFNISKGGANSLFFRMDEAQKIVIIMPYGDYRAISPQIPRSDLGLDFQTFDELLQRDQVADKLKFYGISDELLNDWLAAGYFSTVKHLILLEAEVLPETIKKLVKLPQLTAITIVDSKITEAEYAINQTEREAGLNDALQWVQQQTGWQVQLKKYLGNV